jgi:hypothetical protein
MLPTVARARGNRSGWRRWAHLFVLALVLPLALSSALPTFARVLGGPTAHVCRCEIRGGHSTCACPICNPDRDDLRLNEASLRGKCGDDDLAFGAVLGSAIAPPPGVTIIPPDLAGETPPVVSPRLALVFLKPPTPPPRSALS